MLDITKCFNGFGRIPSMWMMQSNGMTKAHADFWLKSMEKMSRTVFLGGSYSQPRFSTAGCAEGDPIAVCVMVQIGHLWYRLVSLSGVSASAFADNWSWEGRTPEEHVQASLMTQRLLQALRLHSDPAKCWAWGSGPKAKKGWDEISALVFGSPGRIRTAFSEKDLGVQL